MNCTFSCLESIKRLSVSVGPENVWLLCLPYEISELTIYYLQINNQSNKKLTICKLFLDDFHLIQMIILKLYVFLSAFPDIKR